MSHPDPSQRGEPRLSRSVVDRADLLGLSLRDLEMLTRMPMLSQQDQDELRRVLAADLASFHAVSRGGHALSARDELVRTEVRLFANVLAGQMGDEHVRERTDLGTTYHGVGMPPHWYLTSVAWMADQVLPRLWDAFGGDADTVLRATRALLKLLLVDVGFALDAHMRAEVRERTVLETQAADADRMFREIFDATLDGVLRLDDHGVCLDANEAACTAIGLQKRDVVGRGVADVLSGAPSDLLNAIQRMIQENRPGRIERSVCLTRLDGDDISIELSARIHAVQGSHMVRFRDVTAEQRETQVLREIAASTNTGSNQGFLQGIVEGLSRVLNADLVYVGRTDPSAAGTVRMVVAAGFGAQREPRDYGFAGTPCEAVLRTGETQDLVLPSLERWGPASLLSGANVGRYLGHPLMTRSGTTVGLMVVAFSQPRDVSARERLLVQIFAERVGGELEREIVESQSASAQRTLQTSHRLESVGRLTSGIAHEFGNALTVIAGHAERLSRRRGETPPAEVLEALMDAVEQARTLTSHLMTFGVDRGTEHRVTDPDEVLTRVDSMIRSVIRENVAIRVGRLSVRCWVRIDSQHLEELVVGLLIRGAESMPEGGELRVEAATVRLDEAYARTREGIRPGRYLVIAVTDTGPGHIVEDDCNPFDRPLASGGGGENDGLGLQLSSLHAVVRQSGGDVTVFSEPGVGTTFEVYLPCVDEE